MPYVLSDPEIANLLSFFRAPPPQILDEGLLRLLQNLENVQVGTSGICADLTQSFPHSPDVNSPLGTIPVNDDNGYGSETTPGTVPPASPDTREFRSIAPVRPATLKCNYMRTSRPIASGLPSTPSAQSPTSPAPGTTPPASSDVWGRRSDVPAHPVAPKCDSVRTSRPIASGPPSTPSAHSPISPAPRTTPPELPDTRECCSVAPACPTALKRDYTRTSHLIASGPPSIPSAPFPTSPAPEPPLHPHIHLDDTSGLQQSLEEDDFSPGHLGQPSQNGEVKEKEGPKLLGFIILNKGKADAGAFLTMLKNQQISESLLLLVVTSVEIAIKEWATGVQIYSPQRGLEPTQSQMLLVSSIQAKINFQSNYL
ncbi:hypothetical protein BDZ94DRAFT_1338200 [Collybia nuda]|uniref:Uncharacterized protein n=1 Tax=Collybia nuda TaxID=64659 RepID=A0A9P5XVR5_9AGAR|nr:hypothetical protein BDZ94DRAFT_1338200 [Collybia nuda]